MEMKLFNNTILAEKIKESLSSVLPVTAIVLLLLATVFPVPASMLLSFIFGAVLMIIGMGLFTLGAESSMSPIGEYMGSAITKSKNIVLVIFTSLFLGVLITVSEPDLQVLAEQVSSIPNLILVFSVGLGVGIFLMVSMLRILFKIKLKYLLLFFYGIVFILAAFIPSSFLPLAFDSGGVTTGPMTVPFILALGLGVAAIRSDDSANEDSFGLVALCSIGPILAVMILSLIFPGNAEAGAITEMPIIDTSRDLFAVYVKTIPHYLWEMFIALAPIAAFFLIFRAIFGGLERNSLYKILIGLVYTYLGLVLFLVGVNVGFMPVGSFLGGAIASSPYRLIIIPLGMVIGYFIVSAEPAVQVLKKQVEDTTSGAIPGRLLSASLSIGVAVSVGISMVRVLTGISILWILIPGYAIALALALVVPDIFTSIAFDSGGVASGPMTATFLLPFAVGACAALGGDVVKDAFGVVAMVAMTPLITIQILGLVYKIKQSRVVEGIDLAEMEGPEDALIEEISDAPEVIIEDVDEDIDDDIIDL